MGDGRDLAAQNRQRGRFGHDEARRNCWRSIKGVYVGQERAWKVAATLMAVASKE